jgi:repressor LexA
MADRPTVIQNRVLALIRKRLDQGEGTPTYRELCSEFGWSSTATARDHLKALSHKGYLTLSGRLHRRVTLNDEKVPVSRVPIVGRIAAGSPVLAAQEAEGFIPVPAEWASRDSTFALLVRGESMKDAGINTGDFVIVRQQATAEDGDIAVATLDGETTLKRLRRGSRGVFLVAENNRHKPRRLPAKRCAIQGVVVGLLRSYQGVWIKTQISKAGG